MRRKRMAQQQNLTLMRISAAENIVARKVEQARAIAEISAAAWEEMEPLSFGTFAVRAKRSGQKFSFAEHGFGNCRGRKYSRQTFGGGTESAGESEFAGCDLSH